ncbi:MAG: DUF1028 domain-containing protein [Streptosporangiales bacterium]
MTYSIVARDEATGELGCAVQSHFFSVGPIVPWAEAGVGVVATQAQVEVSYGPRGLELLRAGRAPTDALAELLAEDPYAEIRQVAMVDATGRTAVHTGARCIREAGDRRGPGVSVQANMMSQDTVPDAMLAACQESSGDLVDRLLAALDAAQAEGGDIRGRQSAAILVVRGERSDAPWHDRLVDLRVDDHPEPLAELRRLVRVRRAYDAVDRAELAAVRGDTDAATREYAAALDGAGSVEPVFWYGVSLAASGKVGQARTVLAPVFAVHDGWAELLRRLPEAGMFPEDPALLARLLAT